MDKNWSEAQSCLTMFPGVESAPSCSTGELPLHVALKFGAPQPLVEQLLLIRPKSKLWDKEQQEVEEEKQAQRVLKMIEQRAAAGRGEESSPSSSSSPSSPSCRSDDGHDEASVPIDAASLPSPLSNMYPLHLALGSLVSDLDSSSSSPLYDDSLLLRLVNASSCKCSSVNGLGESALAAAISRQCCKAVSLVVLRRIAEENTDLLRLRDEDFEDLPLHVACRGDGAGKGVVELLYELYPEAALEEDGNGELPVSKENLW